MEYDFGLMLVDDLVIRGDSRAAKNKPWKCRGMESMESHKAGFPPFPHPLEIPAGIPTLPRLRRRLSYI